MHNCLSLTRQNPLCEGKFSINGSETTIDVAGNFRSNTADPLRIAAMEGCGLAQLPSYMVGLDIKSGDLQPVLEAYEPSELPLYAVYMHRHHLSAKVRTFVDFIAEQFQPVPYWDTWTENN